MESKFKTNELKPCICGFKPDHYSVSYGKTPYDVFCPVCLKQLARAKCLVTGWHGHAVDYWNKHIAELTLEEMEEEVRIFNEERKKALAYDGEYEGCKNYSYYWVKEEGEKLFVLN